MDELSSTMKRQNPAIGDDNTNANEVGVGPTVSYAGKSIPMPEIAVPEPRTTVAEAPLPEPVSTPNNNPVQTPKAVSRPAPGGIMSAEDFKAIGGNTEGEAINVEDAAIRAERARLSKLQHSAANDFNKMLDESLAAEQSRLDNAPSIEEVRTIQNAKPGAGVTAREIPDTLDQRRKDNNPIIGNDMGDIDLLPSYEDEDDTSPDTEENIPSVDDPAYADYVKNMAIAELSPPAKGYAIERIREARVEVVPSDRAKRQTASLGNDAFANAISRYKKDYFGKVTVPLVNSGFFVDMVGTGVVDIQNLYNNLDENVSPYDYQLEQMRTVMRAVVDTNPKVNRNNLASMIHYADYNMMAYGHVCATMKKIETVANCPECGKPFRCSEDSTNLLMNMDELYERKQRIENAPNIEANSLMTSNREVTTDGGITIILSHPSYQEYVNSLRAFQNFSSTMTRADSARFEGMLPTLQMIRKITLPNGVISSNLLQHYQALQLLTQEDLTKVNEQVDAMNRNVIAPRFGIRDTRCPYCQKVVKNIGFGSIQELLFFHASVTSLLNSKPRSASSSAVAQDDVGLGEAGTEGT